MQPFLTFRLALVLAAGIGIAAEGSARARGRPPKQPVKRGSPPTVVKATGTLEPENVVDIGAQVAGTLQKFGSDPNDRNKRIDFGAKVSKGTILAQLDPAPYQAQLAQARANVQRAEANLALAKAKVTLAEREFQRSKKQQAHKAGDSSDLAVARARLDVARAAVLVKEAAIAQNKAALDQAKLNLSYTTIRSPIDGVVIDRRCNVGQTVTANLNSASLFLIATDLKKMQVWVAVKEANIGRIIKGQPVRFTVDAFPNRTFKGQVAVIRLNAIQVKGQVMYTVEVNVDNRDGLLLPYLTAEVSIEVGGKKQTPIPKVQGSPNHAAPARGR